MKYPPDPDPRCIGPCNHRWCIEWDVIEAELAAIFKSAKAEARQMMYLLAAGQPDASAARAKLDAFYMKKDGHQ